MSDLFKGAGYLLKGFGLLHKKGIRHFAYIPIAINTLLFSVAIWFGISYFDQWMAELVETYSPTWLPEFILDFIMWLLWPVFVSLLLVIVFFSFSIIANILAAPFNGALAEAVENNVTGQSPDEMTWKEIIKDAPSLIWNEFRKLGYFILWMIPLAVLFFIPLFTIFVPFLWILLSSWMLALDYHDYPLGNHQMKFPQQRALLRQKRSLALGFGLATLGATMIPLVNFLVIPAAVAGATVLYLENLKTITKP
ncbi:MAG: sulfate transporter CysZ [Gammaproteobacteria bacterium]|nr:MAG: sulfate transporter CysZ [Gammaproteobacteria bacterium]